jgi:hypothetical protein
MGCQGTVDPTDHLGGPSLACSRPRGKGIEYAPCQYVKLGGVERAIQSKRRNCM